MRRGPRVLVIEEHDVEAGAHVVCLAVIVHKYIIVPDAPATGQSHVDVGSRERTLWGLAGGHGVPRLATPPVFVPHNEKARFGVVHDAWTSAESAITQSEKQRGEGVVVVGVGVVSFVYQTVQEGVWW